MMVFSLKTEQNKDNSRNIWNMDLVIYLLIIIPQERADSLFEKEKKPQGF